MTWQSVGTHTFVPTDKAVQVGSFDLAAGQDTIWVRITQLNPVDDWPFSYGILSWRNANGTPLGSIKAYSNRFGEVFRLGNGLPPSLGTGSIWFEPRGFNLGWLKAGFPWELQFEAQAGSSGESVTNYWNRDPVNGVLSPVTAGDEVSAGTGNLSAVDLGLSGDANVSGTGSFGNGLVVCDKAGDLYASGNLYLQDVRIGPSAASKNLLWDSSSGWLYYETSDYRLKTDVAPLTGSVDLLMKLKPITHRWINQPDMGVVHGFLAHEVQEVVPAAVQGEKDALKENGDIEPQGFVVYRLIPLLVAALQDATKRLDAIEEKLSHI